MNYQHHATPLGCLRLVSDGAHLVGIAFEGAGGSGPEDRAQSDAVLTACRAQLDEYFAGRRARFDLPLAAPGTAFQRCVWEALATIPYGTTRSYGEVARMIGRPRAVRAVGAANGRNPLPVVVPCHRVVGSDGSLTGFAGGLAAKELLLRLEGAWP